MPGYKPKRVSQSFNRSEIELLAGIFEVLWDEENKRITPERANALLSASPMHEAYPSLCRKVQSMKHAIARRTG